MSTAEESVPSTVPLPRELYERVAQVAADQHRPIEDMVTALVAEGLDAHVTVREILESVSAQYRGSALRARVSWSSRQRKCFRNFVTCGSRSPVSFSREGWVQ